MTRATSAPRTRPAAVWPALLVVSAVAGVGSFVAWESLARAQSETMRRALESSATCVTRSPSPAVYVLFGVGMVASLGLVMISRLARHGDGPAMLTDGGWPHRSAWAGIASAAGVLLLVVQVITLWFAYTPDGTETTGQGLTATYCSSG